MLEQYLSYFRNYDNSKKSAKKIKTESEDVLEMGNDTKNNPDDIEMIELDISIRTWNFLKQSGINTLGELLDSDIEELLGKKEATEKIACEIFEVIEKYSIPQEIAEEEPVFESADVADIDNENTVETEEAVKETPEVDLNVELPRALFSQRSWNALRRHGVDTIGQLLSHDRDSLGEIRNLGAKSIEEILAVIEKIKNGEVENLTENSTENSAENSTEKQLSLYSDISELGLSFRSCTALKGHNINTVEQFLKLTEQDITNIRNLGDKSIREILEKIESCKELGLLKDEPLELNINTAFIIPEYAEKVKEYFLANDISVEDTDIKTGAKNALIKSGYKRISEIIFFKEIDFTSIKSIGLGGINSIKDYLALYKKTHADRLLGFLKGDETCLISEEQIVAPVVSIVNESAFSGAKYSELYERIKGDFDVSEERVKNA